MRNYADKGGGTRSLLPFGHGDGGGGPTREMMEKARRLRDLEGSPKVTVEHPDAFFAAARAEYPHAAVWSGELYLELHRATYTTQARTKAGNRRSEHLMREAELWSATATLTTGLAYPYDDLDRLWKVVLLHQFHDILPGSSIAWVHREAEATYAQVRTELEEIIRSAMTAVAGQGGSVRVFNTSPRARAEVVRVPPELPAGPDSQTLADGSAAVFTQVPGSGSAPLGAGDATEPVTVATSSQGSTLENGLVTVRIDMDGLLASVFDVVAGREVLAPGTRGNLLQLHTDLPNHWDAWDIDRHYRRRHTDLTATDAITVIERGPLLASVRVERSFGESRVIQTISVQAGSPAVRIDTEIDWHEREKILKAAFPLDVHADRSAAEIQFGHVYRPTHTNTSWDAARFEISCHRWIHLTEPGYGIALANDATYGHDVTRTTREDGGTTTTARYSLVRAPRSPDPDADQGPHRMTHTLLPGATLADAVAGGYALNLPLRVATGSGPASSLVNLAGDAATIEAVKLADDRSGDVIIRIYESLGGRADTTLHATFPIARAEVTDLLERPLADSAVALAEDGSVPISLRPFQVLTLRLRRAR